MSEFVDLVVPISLAEPDGAFHRSLKYYKEDVPEAGLYRSRLGALLARFVGVHRPHIAQAAGVDWNTVTTVPSSRGRVPHPLEEVVQMSRMLRAEYQPLLTRGPGQVGHQNAADDAYVVTENVAGLHVLVVDDTFTSGARCQSAASALRLAGATVTAIVTLERHVNREHSAQLIDHAREQPFDFNRCCLEP